MGACRRESPCPSSRTFSNHTYGEADGDRVHPIRPGPDLTAAYHRYFDEDERVLHAALLARFAGRKFVLVRGFLTNLSDAAGVMMADQAAALEALQCQVRKVEFNSEDPPAITAGAIAGVVNGMAGRGDQVFLMTHSKGSVDALTALVADPEIRGKVAGCASECLAGASRRVR